MRRDVGWILFFTALLTALTWAWATTRAQAGSYTFTTVDVPFPGASETTCTGLTTHGGLVGGYFDVHGRDQGFTKRGPKFILVPLLTPRTMNNAGHFTGWYHDGALFGFLFTGDDFRTLIVPDSNLTEAVGLNDQGDVVGDYRDAHGQFHAFLWRNGEFSTVDPPFPSTTGYGATGINNAGVIVGGFDTHGYIDDHGVFSQIDVPGATYTGLMAVNNHDVLAGNYCDTQTCYGFTLANGQMDVVMVPGSISTEVFALNDAGQLCGAYFDASGINHGFVATPMGAVAWR
jgi:probable HAF family extracellular repeat protein